MNYAQAKEISPDEIPVIDVSPLTDGSVDGLGRVADQMRSAAEGSGFFYVMNHGVDKDLIARTFSMAERFFKAPDPMKESVKISAHHRGWLKAGDAKMPGNKNPDLKESFVWGLDIDGDDPDYQSEGRLLAPNLWPEHIPEMRETLVAYFGALQTCGERLLQAFATSLGIAPDYFTANINKPVSRGSMVYYPPQPEAMGEDQFGVAPHADFGALTLVCQDNTGGLQVQGKNGEWLTAHPIEGCFVVNVGDLLARWTNDRFKSTPHRVINSSGRERLSIAMFVDPNWDANIAPVLLDGDTANYPPVTCADHITGRYNDSFSYRNDAA